MKYALDQCIEQQKEIRLFIIVGNAHSKFWLNEILDQYGEHVKGRVDMIMELSCSLAINHKIVDKNYQGD